MPRPILILALSFIALASAASAAPAEEIAWSRSVIVATTGVEARPALVVDRAGRAHIFYIDRDAGRGVVRWITAGPDGRIERAPRSIGAADLRARAVAAAPEPPGIRVAWVAPTGEAMRVLWARLDVTSSLIQPLGPVAEDAGPIALAPSAGGVHAVWSQASDGPREIWYRDPRRAASAPVGAGDAPGLSVGPTGPVAVWWQRTGFDTYRLVAARLDATVPLTPGGTVAPEPRPLTGSLATSRLHAPAVAHDAEARLYVVFGTEQRGFGPAVGRLSATEIDAGGLVSPRRSVASGSPFAAQATATQWRGAGVLAWTDLRSGRSRNPEIYVGLMRAGTVREQRLTYTLSASTYPVLAPGPGQALTAVWLEVASGGRFGLNLASTARPAARRFLLGIPELDLHRPGEAAAFAFTALFGTLPYAALLTLATALLTAAVVAIGGPVFADARWWAWLVASGDRAGIAALALALGLQATVAGALFPFIPRLTPGLAVGALMAVWAWTRVRRSAPLTLAQRAAVVLSVVFAASLVLAFAWVARTLSQLAT